MKSFLFAVAILHCASSLSCGDDAPATTQAKLYGKCDNNKTTTCGPDSQGCQVTPVGQICTLACKGFIDGTEPDPVDTCQSSASCKTGCCYAATAKTGDSTGTPSHTAWYYEGSCVPYPP